MVIQNESWQECAQRILIDVHPGREHRNLKLLLTNITTYLNRVFQRTRHEAISNIPDHPEFSFRKTPLSFELAIELDHRLKLLTSYHLKTGNRISELLLSGLQMPLPIVFSQLQTQFLQAQNKNPVIGNVALAKYLGISPQTVKRERLNLFSQYGIRTTFVLDPNRFGLAHFAVHFHVKSLDASQDLSRWIRINAIRNSEFPFLLGHGLDMNQKDIFLLILVPENNYSKNQFEQKLNELQDRFLANIEVYRIHGYFANVSFDCYDHVSQRWRIDSALRTEGAMRFIEQRGPQFSPLQGFNYFQKSISFKQVDWILALSVCEGLLTKNERRNLLHHHGFHLAHKTIWAHEHQLKDKKAIVPYLGFSRLAFEDVICVIAKCRKSTLEILHQIITQFAMSRLYPTDQGALIFIGVPVGGPSLVKQLTRTLLSIPTLSEVTILRFHRDLSLIPQIQTYQLWNTKKAQWEIPNLPKA